jgi:hypothetical protein
VIQSLERHLDEVILGIIGNADEGQPLGLDLAAEAKRRNLDLGLLAFEHPRHATEERVPFFLVELARGHANLLFDTGVANGPAPPGLLLEHDLFRKPVSTPDQVRGRLFRDHV